MTGLRVALDHGSSYELLLSLATVADPHWREVFASAPHTAATLRAPATGAPQTAPRPRLMSEVASFGRYGWINLASLVAAGPSPRTLANLRQSLEEAEPEDLHLLAVGGRRRQLLALIDEDNIRAALRRDRAARRELTRALSSDQTLLTVSPWLRQASSEEVKQRVVAVTTTCGALLLPAHTENVLRQELRTDVRLRRRRLSQDGPASTLAEVAEGLNYAPSPAPSQVVLIPTPAVGPIVVVVDELRRTLIFHPPAGIPEEPVADGSVLPALLAGTRALGDETRLAIMAALRPGERSATDLAVLMAAPRTTLLHHLALLRAAGLIETSVGATNTTVYSLRSSSIEALSRAIADLGPTVEKSRQ